MSTHQARTLTEAYVFLDLTLSGGERDLGTAMSQDPVARYEQWTELLQVTDSWILRFQGPAGEADRIDVRVPFDAQNEASAAGMHFGTGASELIDAGQWVLIRDVYMGMAMGSELHFAGHSTDRESYDRAVAAWDLAIVASDEVLKFLNEGADGLSDEAFWTPMGRALRQDKPEKLTRETLQAEHDFCHDSRSDFISTYS